MSRKFAFCLNSVHLKTANTEWRQKPVFFMGTLFKQVLYRIERNEPFLLDTDDDFGRLPTDEERAAIVCCDTQFALVKNKRGTIQVIRL